MSRPTKTTVSHDRFFSFGCSDLQKEAVARNRLEIRLGIEFVPLGSREFPFVVLRNSWQLDWLHRFRG